MPLNGDMQVDLVTERSNFHKLGEQIRKLVEMLEDGKGHSIHQPMGDAIGSIRAIYKVTESECRDEVQHQNRHQIRGNGQNGVQT